MLFVDKNNNLFRQIVSNKFTPKTNPVKLGKRGEKSTNKLASIKKLLPSTPAKSSKEVNKILKYFKSTKLTQNNKPKRRSYTQASKQNISTTKEVLKIKKTFLNLKTDKI